MRLATILDGDVPGAVVIRDERVLRVGEAGLGVNTVRAIAAGAPDLLAELARWAAAQPPGAGEPLECMTLGPVVPDPGGIYTIGHNYRAADAPPEPGPERPLVYGKAASSAAGHGATLTWNRALGANVDAEVELGVVIGNTARDVDPAIALDHVLGYTIIDDVSSRDPWLDGDQWLIGKSMPGFCPVGPWLVTRDALDPADLRLGCTIDGAAIQDGRTSQLRTSIAEVIAYLSRHLTLQPGDLIATGTPPRLATPPGPERRLRAGDTVTAWIEGIGELTTHIA